MDYKRGIQVSGTYNYHGWLWDIDLTSKRPFHHFPFTFCFLGVNPNYWHPFIGMWTIWLIWMIPTCGSKLVNNMQPCSKQSCLWQWRTWPLLNIEIHYNMAPSMQVGIDPRIGRLNMRIMFICSKQHLLHWMSKLSVSFCV